MAVDAITLTPYYKLDQHIEPSRTTPEITRCIIEDLTDRECAPLVERAVELYVDQLNEGYGPLKVTLLHALAIRGHLGSIKVLLPHVNVNQQDARGWTAFHHATLNQRGYIQLALIGARANLSIETLRNGTPKDYHLMCYPQMGEPDATGFYHLARPYWNPKLIIADWLKPMTGMPTTELSKSRADRIRGLLEGKPIGHAYEAVTEDDRGTALPPEVGFVTKVTDDVAAKQLLWPYSGVVTPMKGAPKSHDFGLGILYEGEELVVRADERGGPASKIADGPATASVTAFHSVCGAPLIHILQSFVDIPAGSYPIIDYGPSHAVKREYCCLRPTLLRDNLRLIYANIARLDVEKPTAESSYVATLFHTPTLLLDLLIDGSISPHQLEKLYSIGEPQIYNKGKQAAFLITRIIAGMAKVISSEDIIAILQAYQKRGIKDPAHILQLFKILYEMFKVSIDLKGIKTLGRK